MKRERYYLSNGFHNSTTFVLVEPCAGAIVTRSSMHRAQRALCESSDCTCRSSLASAASDHQLKGFQRPEVAGLHLCNDGCGAVVFDYS